jgi:hypothetical protein
MIVHHPLAKHQWHNLRLFSFFLVQFFFSLSSPFSVALQTIYHEYLIQPSDEWDELLMLPISLVNLMH